MDDMAEFGGMTVFRGRAACASALRHPALTSDPGVDSANLLFLDGPDHVRLRGLVRSIIAGLEPLPERVATDIRALVGSLGESFDAVRDFARPVAGIVTEALLGTHDIVDDEFLGHLEATSANLDVWSGRVSSSSTAGQRSATRLALLLARADGAPGGALSVLRAAHRDGSIGEDELLLTPVVLAHAAYENSANFLALSVLASAHGDRADGDGADGSGARGGGADGDGADGDGADGSTCMATTDAVPRDAHRTTFSPLKALQGEVTDGRDRRAVAGIREIAVETCPARFVFRRAREDVEIDGTSVAAGSIVAISLRSAGLPFGIGAHACPGTAVALAEADVALTALATKLGPSPAVRDVEWKPHAAFHGPSAATITATRV